MSNWTESAATDGWTDDQLSIKLKISQVPRKDMKKKIIIIKDTKLRLEKYIIEEKGIDLTMI